MKPNALRLGIIGCGAVTVLRHLPALRGVSGIVVNALSDVDPVRLEKVAERFGVPQRYQDYRQLIETGTVDAVAVCLPPKLHAEVALAAIASGKHTFIEKPLALSLEECDQLSAAVACARTLKIMVGFNLRWHRLVLQARDRIERGQLGRINFVRTVFTNQAGSRKGDLNWRQRRAEGGGAIFELGVHHFDLIRFLLREEFQEVYSSNIADDETAVVLARMANGVQAVFTCSQGSAENHEIEVYGELGWLRISCYRADGLEQFASGEYAGSVKSRLRKMGRTLLELPRIIGQLRSGSDFVNTYEAQWRHFAAAVRNEEPVGSTMHDGELALATALAAIAANETKRVVRISELRQVRTSENINAIELEAVNAPAVSFKSSAQTAGTNWKR